MTGSDASIRRSRGMSTPAMRATAALRALSWSLALLHLVLGVVADDQHHALAADDLAPLTPRLDRCSYLHDLLLPSRIWPPCNQPPTPPGNRQSGSPGAPLWRYCLSASGA